MFIIIRENSFREFFFIIRIKQLIINKLETLCYWQRIPPAMHELVFNDSKQNTITNKLCICCTHKELEHN